MVLCVSCFKVHKTTKCPVSHKQTNRSACSGMFKWQRKIPSCCALLCSQVQSTGPIQKVLYELICFDVNTKKGHW